MAMKITVLLAVLAACCVGNTYGSSIAKVGNKILASTSGVDVPGVIFLMDDEIMSDAVLFAFAAFFRSDKAIHFQVWRPNSTSSRDHILLADMRMIPSTLSKESVYLSGLLLPCVRVQKGDRMGIYMEESPGAVAYTFVAKSPTALGYTLPNITVPVAVDEHVTFDSLTFPYDFSVAAYVDTNLTGYATNDKRPKCKPGLLIPDDVTPTLAPKTTTTVTGKPGATGASGPQGIRGSDGATGPKGAQGDKGPIGATGLMGPEGKEGIRGTDGATGATGPAGLPGTKGTDGKDGAAGGMGATGAAGPKGERGLAGPAGPRGPAGGNRTFIQPTAAAVTSTSFFSDPNFIMGLLIWLIIITIIIIIIIITIAVIKNRSRNPYKSNLHKGRMTSMKEDNPSWMDTMKEDYFKDYSNETISTKENKEKLPEYTYENEGVSDSLATSDTLATSDISTQLTDTTSNEEVKNY